MTKLKTSVIIPNWNGLELLKVCLPSIKKQTLKNFEVIIVDNGSTDGSREYIKKNFPEFRVIPLEKNYGFSPAVNIGISKSNSKYIVLINNDTKVDKDCLKYLVRSADKYQDVAMVAAKMLQYHNPLLIDSAGDYIDTVGHANNLGQGEKDGEKFNKPDYLFLATGGGSLFKKDILKKVGYFDDDYFAYMEDVDLCLRIQLIGFKGWYEPKAKIYHIHKATSSRNKAFTQYLQFRNMTMTIIKDFPTKLLLKDLNWLKIILVNINTFRYLTFSGYFLSAVRAQAYILFNLLKILNKRSRIQSSKTVSDDYIIRNFIPKRLTFFQLFKKGI